MRKKRCLCAHWTAGERITRRTTFHALMDSYPIILSKDEVFRDRETDLIRVLQDEMKHYQVKIK